MPTKHEAILLALQASLSGLSAVVVRQEILPPRCPPSGVVNLVPKDPEEQDRRLGANIIEWRRAVDLEVVVQAATTELRAVALDAALAEIGAALFGSRLGELVDYLDLGPPVEADMIPMEGAHALAGATVEVALFYETSGNPMEMMP